MIAAGVDIGSRTTKAVLLDGDAVVARKLEQTTWARAEQAESVLDALLAEAGLSRAEVGAVWATGYGRVSAPFADGQATEITCHARGAYFLDPAVRTVIDVGGQDTKVIHLDDAGQITDFRMNDRCAAGTGKFLEELADTLGLELSQFVAHGRQARRAAEISSLCTVFAESEAISLLAEGVPLEEVILGLHRSIAGRVGDLARAVGAEATVAFSGGGAKNAVLHRELETKLNQAIQALAEPEFTGALGAALLACRS